MDTIDIENTEFAWRYYCQYVSVVGRYFTLAGWGIEWYFKREIEMTWKGTNTSFHLGDSARLNMIVRSVYIDSDHIFKNSAKKKKEKKV